MREPGWRFRQEASMLLASVRRIAVATLVVFTIIGGRANAQSSIYVHARTGCDANTGLVGSPYQTITRALSQAGTPAFPLPVTIRIAGALQVGTSNPVAYDNSQNPPPGLCSWPPLTQGVETFPLVMRGDVSLVWDAGTSDQFPGTTIRARPLITFTTAFSGSLLQFGATYATGASFLNLTSLDLQYGAPAIEMNLGASTGTIGPGLNDLRVFDSGPGLLGSALSPGQYVYPRLTSPQFVTRSTAPAGGPFDRHIRLQATGPYAFVGATVSDGVFRAEPPSALTFAAIEVSAFAGATGSPTASLSVDKSLFDGGTSSTPAGQGMRRGIVLDTASGPGPGIPDPRITASVSDTTFQYVELQAIRFPMYVPSTSTTYNESRLTVSNSIFAGNNRTLLGGATGQGHIEAQIEPGNHMVVGLSGNTISDGLGDGIFLGVTNPGAAFTNPGTFRINIDKNEITKTRDGIHLLTAGTTIAGGITRNGIFLPERYGINNDVQGALSAASSSPSIVNNIIGYPEIDGIRNVVTGAGAVATPIISFNTIASSPTSPANGAGLRNTFYAGAAEQAFFVTNTIFRYNSAGDIVSGPPGSPAGLGVLAPTVTYCNFASPTPVAGSSNNSLLPGFVNPLALDFHLLAGSAMLDDADDTPPPSGIPPALDFDGNARIIDLLPLEPPGTRSDRGADERRP